MNKLGLFLKYCGKRRERIKKQKCKEISPPKTA